MELLLTFLGVRAMLASKVGIAVLVALCLGVMAIPLVVKVPHLTATGIVSALACVWLVRRLINLKK